MNATATARNVLALVVLTGAGCGGGSSGSVDGAPDGSSVDSAAVPSDGASADAAGPDAVPVVLTSNMTFASALGSLCGIGFDPDTSLIWAYPCNGAELHAFSSAGVASGTIARPGEAANDVDVTFAPAAVVLRGVVPDAFHLFFVNGETGVAEVYDPTVGTAPLVTTAFGDSHVVGGAIHVARASIFVVQDNVAPTNPNTVAELDRATGAVIDSWSTLPAFDVNYGDLEVCQGTGNLFVVSSVESTVAELTPTGALVGEYPLPAGVGTLSGIGLAPGGEAWVSGTDGGVWRLEGLPCP